MLIYLVSDGNLAVLLSYSGKEISDDFRRLYALVELRLVGNGFTVVHLNSVPYQTVRGSKKNCQSYF
jgi:hypothetical protein